MELTLCANCLNYIKCTCRLLKANQASSEYERELINFVNPKDYPGMIPICKLRISKDFPKRTHHLGTNGVKVMKAATSTKLQKQDQRENVQVQPAKDRNTLHGSTAARSDKNIAGESQSFQHHCPVL